jgi:predicted CoA-binding protein
MVTDRHRMDDERLRDLLLTAIGTIAVVGIKAGERDDAFRVPRYMQQQGYRIIPVSPKLSTVLGEPVFGSLSDLDEPADLVNLFRAADHIAAHTDEILSLTTRPKAVWMQLGIRDEQSAARLREAGIAVIEDRCLMVEHKRLSVLGAAGNEAAMRPGDA